MKNVPRSTPCRGARCAALLALAVLPLAASAHVGADGAAHHGLASGFTHPFTGLDHLLAMVAVGAWCALAAPAAALRQQVRAPIAFALLLLAGALLAATGLALPAVEPMIAASLLVLGLLVAARARLGTLTQAVLVGLFALFHGAAHGQELAGAAALAGMVAATALLHLAGIGLGRAAQARSVWWPRAAGLATAAAGATLLLG